MKKKRLNSIQQWAIAHGWTVGVGPTPNWTKRLPGRYIGSGFVDVLVSSTAFRWPVSVAEYRVIAWSGSVPVAHDFVVTVVQLVTSYPPVAVRSRDALSRLWRTTFGNATATGHGEFDRRFRVKTRNPELVKTLLSPTLIAAHL